MKANLLCALPVLVLAIACSDAGQGGATLGGSGSGATTAGTGGGGGYSAGGSSSGNAGTGVASGGGNSAGSGGTGSMAGSSGTGVGGSSQGGFMQGGTGQGGGAQGGSGGSGGVAPTDGKGIYDANCKVCHGELGAGTVLAPEIQHPVTDYATWVIRNGRAQTTYAKPMDAWGQDKLTDDQLKLVLDYLATPPQPTTGQALFVDYCANCHGMDAKSGIAGKNLLGELNNITKMVRGGKNVGQYQNRKDAMPIFSTMLLSDQEVQMIHDYIASL